MIYMLTRPIMKRRILSGSQEALRWTAPEQVGQLLLKYIKKAQMSFPLSVTYTLAR